MDEMHPISRVVVTITAVASVILSTWWTVIAFIGGTMPITGWETNGGLGFGIFWLMIVDPIALAVCFWASVIVSLPIVALLDRDTSEGE